MRPMLPLHTEKTSTGLDANVAAALSYLFGFVTGAVFLILEKRTGSFGSTPCSRRWRSAGLPWAGCC